MRVSIESCGTETEAYQALNRVRQNETYKNAWVQSSLKSKSVSILKRLRTSRAFKRKLPGVHIHNFQHVRVAGSDIDYITNSAGSLARKVKPIEGTVFCSPEPGFSIVSASKKTLELRMIDKKGNVLHTVTRSK